MFALRPFRRKNEDVFERMLSTFNELFDQIDEFPALNGNLKSLRTDIKENKDAYVVEADLPGFSKDDITIEVENNQLTIRAKREEEQEAKDSVNRIIRRERHFGEFVRQFYVDNIDENRIEAELKDGVLKIILPKRTEGNGPRKHIKIK
jgi:HSP20 family protein